MIFTIFYLKVLKERCPAKLNNCQGSESYRKGVLYACLNSHPHVSEQLEQYKNFVLCNDKLMNDIVASVEQITVNQGKIKIYKANWDKEYQDAEHRDELLDVSIRNFYPMLFPDLVFKM